MVEISSLWKLYLPLVGWVGLGWGLGRILPPSVLMALGKFLFWLGVPLSIVAFLRQADLAAAVWIAPVVCWVAILLGAGLAWAWIQVQFYLKQPSGQIQRSLPNLLQKLGNIQLSQPPSQGSFLLAAMMGNTGYLGFPIALGLVGPQYFGWALFYDMFGSGLGSYGLGVLLAAHFGGSAHNRLQLLLAVTRNPALWSFGIGLCLRPIALPEQVEQGLQMIAWTIVALSLLLLGMRLSQLHSWRNLQPALISLSIKMLIVPLFVGFSLVHLGLAGFPLLAIVLQASMPPAFATLVIAEAYDLDRDLTVTTLALGSVLILILLPLWLALFSPIPSA